MKFFSRSTERGDTIVEVLIAVVVISSMLVGAYSIANKSTQQIRMSQERSESSGLTTAVLEQLKSNDSDLTNSNYLNKWVCYNLGSSQAGVSLVNYPSASKTDVPNWKPELFGSASDTSTSYNSDCLFSTNGGAEYITFVKHTTDDFYEVQTRWDGLNGQRQQQTLLYRSE